jgi:hypothetical protein
MREPDRTAELGNGYTLKAWHFDQDNPPSDAEIMEIDPDGLEHWPGEGWFLTKWML